MFDVLNNSKFFAGLTMLAVNLGSKYLAHELSDSQQELFNNKISNNEYVEFAKVFGNYYGSLHKNVMDLHNNGYHVLFDIDWQGAKQLKSSNYSDILSFFIRTFSVLSVSVIKSFSAFIFNSDNKKLLIIVSMKGTGVPY